MNYKIDYIKNNINLGCEILKFKKKNRRAGKLTLLINKNKKQIIELFGDELKETADIYYEYLIKQNEKG